MRNLPRLTIALTVSASLATLSCLLTARVQAAEARNVESLAVGLQPFLTALSGQQDRFEISGTVRVPIDGKPQEITLQFARRGDEAFDLDLTHADYAVQIRRRAAITEFGLPKHGVVFVGGGEIASTDRLSSREIVSRLVTPRSLVAQYVPVVFQPDAESVAGLLQTLLGATFDPATARRTAGKNVAFEFPRAGKLTVQTDKADIELAVADSPRESSPLSRTEGVRVVEIDRTELERQLVRGVRRAIEILAPSPLLTDPPQVTRKVPHGELRWIENHGLFC